MDFINLLTQILGSPVGSFAFVLGLMVLGGWLIHWVTKKVTEITSSHSTIKENADKFDLYINELRKDMAYVKGTLEIIKNQDNEFAQAHSPISLTEKGKKIANDNHLLEMVNANWQQIVTAIDSQVVNKNAYDIQQYCIRTMAIEPNVFLSDSDVLILKQQAYNAGRVLQDYSIIPAILIRDKYFQEKNIEMADVDKYDPTK